MGRILANLAALTCGVLVGAVVGDRLAGHLRAPEPAGWSDPSAPGLDRLADELDRLRDDAAIVEQLAAAQSEIILLRSLVERLEGEVVAAQADPGWVRPPC